MGNYVLFVSSLSLAILHGIAQLWFRQKNEILTTTISCGIATSIWNHGVTSRVAKLIDRGMMWVGFFSNLYSIAKLEDTYTYCSCLATLFLAGILYIAAKLFTSRHVVSKVDCLKHIGPNIPHVLAHLTLTLTHVMLMRAHKTM